MRRSDEAGNWFLPSIDWPGLADHPLLLSFLFLALAWVFLAGTRAIIGEYFKLFWFRRVHTPRFERAQAALATARQDLEAERAELGAFRRSLDELLDENDRLLREVIQLRARRSPTSLILPLPGLSIEPRDDTPDPLDDRPLKH